MIVRILHILVIGMLVFAAAYVYRIKMASTVRTERVLKLQADIHKQRDAIAALHAEWNKLELAATSAGSGRAASGAEADQRHAI